MSSRANTAHDADSRDGADDPQGEQGADPQGEQGAKQMGAKRPRQARWPAAGRQHRTSGSDWVWRPTRWAIYHRDNFACLHCGDVGCDENPLTLDHVDDDGGNGPENLITLCNDCNASRGAKTISEFSMTLALRASLQIRIPIDRAKGRELCAEFLRKNNVRRSRQRRRAKRLA